MGLQLGPVILTRKVADKALDMRFLQIGYLIFSLAFIPISKGNDLLCDISLAKKGSTREWISHGWVKIHRRLNLRTAEQFNTELMLTKFNQYREQTISQLLEIEAIPKDTEEVLAWISAISFHPSPKHAINLHRIAKLPIKERNHIYDQILSLFESRLPGHGYNLERGMRSVSSKKLIGKLFEIYLRPTKPSVLKQFRNIKNQKFVSQRLYQILEQETTSYGIQGVLKRLDLELPPSWYDKLQSALNTNRGQFIIASIIDSVFLSHALPPLIMPKAKYLKSFEGKKLASYLKHGIKDLDLKELGNLTRDMKYDLARRISYPLLVATLYVAVKRKVKKAFDKMATDNGDRFFEETMEKLEASNKLINKIMVQGANEIAKTDELGKEMLDEWLQEKYGSEIPTVDILEQDSSYLEMRYIYLGQ